MQGIGKITSLEMKKGLSQEIHAAIRRSGHGAYGNVKDVLHGRGSDPTITSCRSCGPCQWADSTHAKDTGCNQLIVESILRWKIIRRFNCRHSFDISSASLVDN